MTKEIQFTGVAGANAYAIITNPADGLVRDVVAGSWDTYLDADIDDYDVVLTRKGTSSQHYEADLPAGLSTTALYKVDVFQRVGSNPAVTDPLVGSGTVGPVDADAVLISKDAAAADNLEAMLDGTGAELTLASSGTAALSITNSSQFGDAVKISLSDGYWLNVAGGATSGVNNTKLALAGSVMSADLFSISGDSTAANNLESLLDGTGAAVTLTGIDVETTLSAIRNDTGTALPATLSAIQGGTFNGATDSLEAIRDRGDAAWTGLTASALGTAQAGAATTVTLAAGSSATDDYYNGQRILITGGTGAGQSRAITDYNGATKVATVHRAWQTNPDNTSTYEVQAAQGDQDQLHPAVDGVTGAKLLEILLSTLAGITTETDNGDGTKTLRMYKQDGTTAILDITYNTTSAMWTATTIDP